MAKIKIYHFGKIENGKLSLNDRPKFQCAMNVLEGCDVRLTIERKPKPRKNSSDPQRRYYWAVIIKRISDKIGLSPDETHDLCKSTFLTEEIVREGRKFIVIKSTETLSTIEREEYHASLREWASLGFPEKGSSEPYAPLSLYIELPGEVEF